VGLNLSKFEQLTFNDGAGWGGRLVRVLRLSRLPILLNVLKGDLSFVGPRAKTPDQVGVENSDIPDRYGVRPGIVSLWWIRNQANIHYGTESETDLEYVRNVGLRNDIGILLRSIPAYLFGSSVEEHSAEVKILGIRMHNLTMTEALDQIIQWLSQNEARQVCFVNADCANVAYRNEDYRILLNESDLCLADGIGLKIGGKLTKQVIVQNVNGTDMFPKLCESLSKTDRKLFLLGGRPEVVEGVSEWVTENFTSLHIDGYHHGYFSSAEEESVLMQVRDSGADLLLVAFGAPRQDLWIKKNIESTGARVAMGVGGLFDFYSGRIPRAPLWMREIGMEWFYRFTQEPGRLWKRYFVGNAVFLYRVIKERIVSPK
jgi:N-acetylglucosaminyldiphosphoundecaprenol N-acetyl-beta-D-mannosaminyltransferase